MNSKKTKLRQFSRQAEAEKQRFWRKLRLQIRKFRFCSRNRGFCLLSQFFKTFFCRFLIFTKKKSRRNCRKIFKSHRIIWAQGRKNSEFERRRKAENCNGTLVRFSVKNFAFGRSFSVAGRKNQKIPRTNPKKTLERKSKNRNLCNARKIRSKGNCRHNRRNGRWTFKNQFKFFLITFIL